MAESWLDRQNSKEAILALTAADTYWSIVQRWRAIEAFVFVLIPTLLAALAQFVSEIAVAVAVVGFALTVIDATLAYPLITASRRRAAQAEDQFDALALSLPRSLARQIDGPDTAELHRISSAQAQSRANRQKDWYTPKLGDLPISLGRIACMREVTSWDGALRDNYVRTLVISVVCLSLAFLTYGLIAGLKISEFMVRILFPLSPAILWIGRELWDQYEADLTVARLREALSELWRLGVEKRIPENDLFSQTVDLSGAIFAYRLSTPPVPELLYHIHRQSASKVMMRTADDLVDEYRAQTARPHI